MSDRPTDDTGHHRSGFEPSQTSLLGLLDNQCSPFHGLPPITVDTDVLPDDPSEEAVLTFQWSLEAVYSVMLYPNLVLWTRTADRDVLFAHHPSPHHERAGYLRAASFERPNENRLTEASEIDAGLITPFDAMSVLYNVIQKGLSFNGVSLLLVDVSQLQSPNGTVKHPIVCLPHGPVTWGQGQFVYRLFPHEPPDSLPVDIVGLTSSADGPIPDSLATHLQFPDDN